MAVVFLANGGIFVMDARLMIDARVMYWQRLLIVDLGVIIDDSSNDSSHRFTIGSQCTITIE